jgi:hypothetical protein
LRNAKHDSLKDDGPDVLVQREMESQRSLLASITAISAAQFGRHHHVVAGGQGRLLKLQLVSTKGKSGWLAPQATRRETRLARKGINYDQSRRAAAESFGKR